MIPRLVAAVSLAIAIAGPVAGSVVTEADGQFSKHWKDPTVIGPGVDTILGTAEKQNGHEFLALTGLASGAQTLSFEFTAPSWALMSDSYSAGGQILWSTDPFRSNWDGAGVGSYQLSRWTPRTALDLVLGEGFTGTLYLGIYFTHGKDVAWRLSAPSAAARGGQPEAAAVVPLNATAGYALAGLALLATLGLWGRSRREDRRGGLRTEEQGSPTTLRLSRPLPA